MMGIIRQGHFDLKENILKKKKEIIDRLRSTNYVPILIIIVSCLLFFSLGIFANKRAILGDTADEYFPTLWYTGHLWRAGIVPLWNAFLFNGYPCFADPQNQTFYPINLIISLFTNFSAKVVYLQLVFHYVLAGLFMYLFTGLHMRNAAGRTIASLIYMFNGYMMIHFHQLTMINSVVWLPLILFFLEKGWRNRDILYFFPAGISVSFLIFAGHPQTILYMSYAILAFALFKCFVIGEGRRFSFFPLVLFSLSYIFGILLGAIQLIPSYEFSNLSNRSGSLSYEFATLSGQIDPAYLITLFFPNYFGAVRGPFIGQHNAFLSAYLGFAFIMFLPFSFRKNKKEAFFFGVMSLVALLVSMGDHGYIFRILFDYLPGFGLFRAPAYFSFVFAFFGALLTGIGIENILEKNPPGNRIHYAYWIFVFMLISVMVVLTDHGKMLHFNRLCDFLTFGAMFLSFVWILHLWKKDKISKKIFYSAFILLVVFDFFIHGFDAKTLKNKPSEFMKGITVPLKIIKETTGVSQRIKIQEPFLTSRDLESGLYRIYVDDGINSHEERIPLTAYDYLKLGYVAFNRSIFNKFFMVDGCKPLMLKRYILFNALLRDKNYDNFLKLSNVKYVVKDWSLVEVLPDTSTLKRAYIVNQVLSADNTVRDVARQSATKFHSGNLLEDGGFELPKTAEEWGAWGNLNPVKNPAPVRSGQYAVRVAAKGTGLDFTQRGDGVYIPVIPGETYYFEGFHIHSGRGLGTSGFLVEWTDRNKSHPTWGPFLGDPGKVWTKRSGDIRVPAGRYFARIIITVRSDMKSGYAYFDDIVFRRVPQQSLAADFAIINILSDHSFDARKEAVVEGAPDMKQQCETIGTVQILEYLPNRVILEAESACPAFLVLSDAYYPGWKVKIDSGTEIEPVKTNYLFRGVNIPSGEHTIIFEFKPKSFRIGLLISVSALILGSIASLIVLRKR